MAQRTREPATGTVAMQSQTPSTAPPIAAAPAQPAATPASAAPSAVALPASAATPGAGVATSAPPPVSARAKAAASAAAANRTVAVTPRKPPPRPDGTTRAQPAAPSAPEIRIPKLTELPDELRRGVPPLAFGGAIYSEVAAQRMVILNGQLLREGEALSADLTLETIRAKSAVLRIKGERFELVF
jgi:general secretion pathway protein B